MDHEYHYPQNPNPSGTHVTENPDTPPEFVIGDYLLLEDGGSEEGFSPENMASSDSLAGVGSAGSASATSTDSNGGAMKRSEKDHAGFRVVFRTKSELEVLDDGFKWRKYGKKMVKSSPNPRNYYKCASGECNVKKRVERDREDPSYVMTTYEGVHNHESPCVVYYNHTPSMVPHGWTLQPTSSQSSPS